MAGQCRPLGVPAIASGRAGTVLSASERLTGALLDRLTHHVHILKMNGHSFRLKQSKQRAQTNPDDTDHA